MKKLLAGMMVFAMILAVNTTDAHPGCRSVKKKQYNQHARINHGVRNGQLTVREARGLKMQQAKVRHYKTMAMADGRVSPAERRLIRSEQRKASRNIYHQKHDRQTRRW